MGYDGDGLGGAVMGDEATEVSEATTCVFCLMHRVSEFSNLRQ